MPRIFISYRRSDSITVTGRIYDRLVAEFGRDSVFKDVDSIPYGDDFRRVLEREVASCDVVLVIMGTGWANAADSEGKRRLNDPNDFVRIEVETGLRLPNVVVIPVLVQGARMPVPADLPDGILREQMPFLNAPAVRDDPDFHTDMNRLVTRLRSIRQGTEPALTTRQNRRGPFAIITLVVVLALVGIAVLLGPSLAGLSAGPTATPTDLPPSPTQLMLPGTETQLIQLDTTATEAMLQRTVDARATENALLLAENTQIAAETQTASVPTVTDTATLTDTPTITATATSSPTPTSTETPSATATRATLSAPIFSPTPEPPTATRATLSAPIFSPTPGYPCEGTIINPDSSASIINILYLEPSESAQRGPAMRVGTEVTIQRVTTDAAGKEWYLLYDGTRRLGWALTRYVNPSTACS